MESLVGLRGPFTEEDLFLNGLEFRQTTTTADSYKGKEERGSGWLQCDILFRLSPPFFAADRSLFELGS